MRAVCCLLMAGALGSCASVSLATEARNPYLAVHGGLLLVWFQEPEFTQIDVATDPMVGATFGFFVERTMSLDAEVGYAWGRGVGFEQKADEIVTDSWPTGNILLINANVNFWFDLDGTAKPFVICGIGAFHVERVDQETNFAVDGEPGRRRVWTEATTDIALNLGGGVLLRKPGLLGARLEMRQYVVFGEEGLDFALRITAGVVLFD